MVVDVGGLHVPEELRSLDHPVWDTPKAVAGLLVELGLPALTSPTGVRALRMLRVVEAWAKAHGIVSQKWPDRADQARLRALGVYWPRARDRMTVVDPHVS